jgi:hypothetical protein
VVVAKKAPWKRFDARRPVAFVGFAAEAEVVEEVTGVVARREAQK